MTTTGRTGGGTPGDADRDPRLDRSYRDLPRDEPPAHLDAAILAAAHREVGARPRPASDRLRAWRVPVSIAAVVVLSVSVVTLVREEGGDKLDSSTASMASRNRAPAAQMAEERASARDQAAPAESARDAGKARSQEAAKPEAPQRKAARDDAAPASTSAAKKEADQRAAAESAKRSEDAARRSAGAAAERSASAEPRVPAPPPAAPAPQSPQGGPVLRDSRPAPSTGSLSGADGARSSAGIRGSSGDNLFAASPEEQKAQGALAPLPQGASAPVDRPAARERAAATDSAGSLQPSAPAQPAAKAAPRLESRSMQAEGSAATANRLSPLLKELDAQPAEKWVEKIEALRRDGRRPEADELLVAFKRRFPDYPLPAALR